MQNKPMWETCEVFTVIASIPIPITFAFGTVSWHVPSLGFRAEATTETTTGRQNVRSFNVVATANEIDMLQKDEITAVRETQKRRKMVESLFKKLVDDGWEPAGKGESWYSFRFRRRIKD